jgi:uroporphyrinogen decarboxylase
VTSPMTSMERVFAAMDGREPDRVPLFLLLTMHGAETVGMRLTEYWSDPAAVAEGQLRLRAEYGHDCLVGAPSAAQEVAAWGADVILHDDGPPNCGQPPILDEDIGTLEAPRVEGNPALSGVLETIRILAERCDDAPIVGGVIAPFTLPIVQLGFERCFNLLRERPALFDRLVSVNEEFCVRWANAQLAAGATAIGYADPLASSTLVDPEVYRARGQMSDRRTIARIDGPVALNFASGRSTGVLDGVLTSGAVAVQVSSEEDLGELKWAIAGRATLIGNLNGVAMRRWTEEEAERQVRRAVAAAAPGGRFVLADNHGEIPLQVGSDVLHAIVDAVRRWGTYPIAAETA